MFFFGDPKDTAKLFWENALKTRGPSLPDCPIDEMEEQDLRNAFTYLYMAARNAIREGVSPEVLEVLMEEYDKAFKALAEASDGFKEVVRSNRHVYIGGYAPENIKKYKGLAGV